MQASPGGQVITCFLHDAGHAELIHLTHGEGLHPQHLQDVAEEEKTSGLEPAGRYTQIHAGNKLLVTLRPERGR